MLDPILQERLEAYLEAWRTSPAAMRIDEVEAFATAAGAAPFEGQPVSDFIAFILNDLLVFLAANPAMLETVVTQEVASARVEKFLEEEQAKLDEAGKLLAELNSYRFGLLDPRYHRAVKRYRAVVSTFKLGNRDYILPSIHELKD